MYVGRLAPHTLMIFRTNKLQVNILRPARLPFLHVLPHDILRALERVFADAKEKHFMRYTHFRGLEGNFDEVFKTITADNGSEFLDSDTFSIIILSFSFNFVTKIIN